MHTVPSFIDILRHTPRWVWLLLAVVVAAGMAQARPQRPTLKRVTVLPAVLAALSLFGVAHGFSGAAGLAGWACGLAAASTLGLALGAPAAAQWDVAERRLAVPGSWLPLALMLGIFTTKFAVGVLVALSPALRGEPGFAGMVGLAYGAFSGLFVGRALALRGLVQPGRSNAMATA